ncbi:MAG: DUF1778 domain-containing protein [Acidobacteria bacterium]|nr:DUF1778 domain-containing protein [Acidobacteriota bacterium]
MASIQTEKLHLDFRVNREAKELIEKAAIASNQTLDDFALTTLLKTSEPILERQQITQLSHKDRERFLALLDEADALEPNAALRRAALRYKRQKATYKI